MKSGYLVGLDVRRIVSSSGQSGVGGWWRKLWNLQIPNKVKIFIWRVWHNIIPVLTNLSKRGINTAGCCTRCKQEPETLIHALVECPAASLIWQQSAFGQ